MILTVNEVPKVKKGILIRKIGISFLTGIIAMFALAAALNLRIGETQTTDFNQAERGARMTLSALFGVTAIILAGCMVAYSILCQKVLRIKELTGGIIIENESNDQVNLRLCSVRPLFAKSAFWPLDTVTVLSEGRNRIYVSLDLLDDVSQFQLLDAWSSFRGMASLRASELQEKVTPR